MHMHRAVIGILLLVLQPFASPTVAHTAGSEAPTRRRPAAASSDQDSPARIQVLRLAPDRIATVARQLAADGVLVIAALPDHALLVAGLDASHVQALGAAVEPWTWQQALVPELRRMDEVTAKQLGEEVPLVVKLAPGADAGAVARELTRAGATVRWIDSEAQLPELGLRVPRRRLVATRQALAATPGLVVADLQPQLRLRNQASAWLCQSGEPGVTPLFAAGLDGNGQIVGVMDTGIDADSCFFSDLVHGLPPTNGDTGTVVDLAQRKVVAVDFYWDQDWPDPGDGDWDDQGHGSHVAGSIAGNQMPYRLHNGRDGMAPGARLVVQDGGAATDDCADLPGLGCPVRNLGPMLQQAYDQGARIHSDSWGDEENIKPFNRYTERTADIDRFCWEHKDFLVFIAAGNAGAGFDTVGSPATGKNVVAVGATQHGDLDPPCVVGFSSRGWTHDGRIKPDVVAPGSRVISARSDHAVNSFNCDVRVSSGTSMATPTAAGLAALVRQYFEDGHYPPGVAHAAAGFEPSAALVKAVLIASAVDLSTVGCGAEPIPSRDQGWGLVQLDRALVLPGSEHRLWVDDHGQGFEAPGEPPVTASLHLVEGAWLKVVLVWTDPPSTAVASTNLVNDLDLEVTGPDGTFLGNALANGVSVSGGTADRLNNVEVVWLPEAGTGEWTVRVIPHSIDLAPQDFALVVLGRFEAPAPRPSGPRVR